MSERWRAILFLGLPGAGKGTQGKIIGRAPGFHHSASGDAFRALDPQTPVGSRVHERIGRGEMLSDDLAIDLWHEYVQRGISAKKFQPDAQTLVLDGIPRTRAQAQMLEKDVDVRLVIHLAADEEQLVRRLTRRADIENRADDSDEQIIRKRMTIHRGQIDEVIGYYGERVTTVSAGGAVLEVLRDVVNAILASGVAR